MEGKSSHYMALSIYLIIQDKWIKWQELLEAGKTGSRKEEESDKCGGLEMDFRGGTNGGEQQMLRHVRGPPDDS